MTEKNLREYRAIIWRPAPTVPGVRVTVIATSMDDASRQLKNEHGEDTIISLYNEEDANKLR